MKLYKNKFFITAAGVAVLTLALGIISKSGDNVVTDALNTISTPVQGMLNSIVNPIKEKLVLIDEMNGYKAENERLIEEITRLKIENRDIQSYVSENDRLRSLLELKEKNAELTTVAAEIVSRDYECYKCMTINKGTHDDISVGDAVITQKGILGVVESVGVNWAKVTTVFAPESAIGAKFTRTGDVGVIEGDSELCTEGKCRVEYISSSASIINGDIVVTSGIGGIYPTGLMIGKICEVKTDAMGAVEYAVLEPSVDVDNVYEVLVVTEFKETADAEKDGDDDE